MGYEEQLSAAKFRAERDLARQELYRARRDAENMRVELCSALVIDVDTGWSDAMAELDRRLMPEGMEWPRFEDGEPVRIGDVVSDVEVRSVVFRDGGILLSDCTSVPGWGTWRSYKEPIKRPVVDTWERLEEDAEKDPCGYFGFDGEETCGKCPASGKNCEQTMARDLVRRCRALAERSE